MVTALKRECRKAERRRRKTKLQSHHDLYKQSLCSFNYELCRAKMINRNIDNTCTLFVMVDKLTTAQNVQLFSTKQCNEFAYFFSETIRPTISTTQSNNETVPPLQPPGSHLIIMLQFNTIDQNTRGNSSAS